MEAKDVIEVVTFLQDRGIRFWIDGGWGVDALLGEKTRAHNDLDIAVELSDRDAYDAAVADAGFEFLYRDGPLNWVVRDDRGREIDVHLVDTTVEATDSRGKQVYGGIPYDVGCFDGVGTIGGVQVRCCTAEFQMVSHTGYEIGETDVDDVAALHRRFGIPVPNIYDDLIDT
jgi:lincosamide nucleotidyltransferase A/C/D/E